MEKKTEIRGYMETDYETFKAMFGEYFSSDLKIELPAEELDEICTEIARQVREEIGLLDLVILDGKAVGFAEYQVDTPQSDWCEKEGFGCMREVYIARECRKTGLGRMLADHAESKLRALGVPSIYLTADDAIDFWLKMGYRDSGEVNARNELSVFIK